MLTYVFQVFSSLFAGAVVLIDRAGGDYGYLYLWIALTVTLIFFSCVCPAFIAPRIGFFTSLPVGNLRTQAEAMAASVGFPPNKIYAVAGTLLIVPSKMKRYSSLYLNKQIMPQTDIQNVVENWTLNRFP
jgi:STE24 endopeptidase